MPLSAAPGAVAAWPDLPQTVRPKVEEILERLARKEPVEWTHERTGDWSRAFGVSFGKTVAARASRRARVFFVPEAGGWRLLGFGDRTDRRLYRR